MESSSGQIMKGLTALVCTSGLLISVSPPSVSAKPASKIDTCLVGRWVLKRMWYRAHGPGLSTTEKKALAIAGLSGATMTIRKNGYTTVVLTGSAPYIGHDISQRLVGTETFFIDARKRHPDVGFGDELLPDRFHTNYGASDILSPIHTSIIDTRTVDYPPSTRTYQVKDFFGAFYYTCSKSTLTMDIDRSEDTSWTVGRMATWNRVGP